MGEVYAVLFFTILLGVVVNIPVKKKSVDVPFRHANGKVDFISFKLY